MIINIDKPYGWTSTDVVRKVRSAMVRNGYPKRVKVGHAGTLDPLATGVLLVCTEKDTKRVNELQAERKEYLFTVELGATTVSFDMEHPVSERFAVEHITEEMIRAEAEKFRGEQMQVPPLYSAKRIDGQRAYELARSGQMDVEVRSAAIEIYEVEVVSIEMPYVTLRVECSKGTYVRSIARDLGEALGSGGYLTSLRRLRSGGYSAERSVSVEEAIETLIAHRAAVLDSENAEQ
ncbi:MAG: tRNA pseudouridine(55) synthase TruB [Rikenellaceae bacterium]